MTTIDELDLGFEALGAAWKVSSVSHLEELRMEMEAQFASGRVHAGIYEDYVRKFDFEAPEGFEPAGSIVTVAIPQGISIVTFQLDGREMRAVIPPVYIFRKTRALCAGILAEVLGNETKIDRARVPLKLVAAKSGLGKYGKNSLCYTERSGSFARLESFFVDYRFGRDDWGSAAALEQCGECNRCAAGCPTQCIAGGGFSIDAGRCLTFYNESDLSFPNFVDRRAHNALVGCMRCQSVCPPNRAHLKQKTKVASFDEKDTLLILNNGIDKSTELSERLKQLDMDEYRSALSRNLKALIRG